MNGGHGDGGAPEGRHPPSRAAGSGDGLADHEATAVETVARLRAAHDERSTMLQRAVDKATDLLGRPAAAVSLLLVFGAWTALAAWRSRGRLDEPMAVWLELAATLAAVLTAILIFASQRRSDLLGERRAELTLQLALLADAKNARIIKLMQELRRDLPSVADRLDSEADEMATPVDPGAVLDAMETLSSEPKS